MLSTVKHVIHLNQKRDQCPHTLNARLRELLHYELIEYHLERKDTRTEWYTITERGEKVLQHIKKLQKLPA
jgi:DNA-binding HxlR family transcriptional regulator